MKSESQTAPGPELERLIDQLHNGNRLRVWSIIFTIFGDAVVPRGGFLWAGALAVLLDRLRIEPGAIRAALSRLAAEGWLERTRRGRNSYYAMSAAGRQRLDLAIRQVYSASAPPWSGRWRLCITPQEDRKQRECRRQTLMEQGFVALAANIFLKPVTADAGPEKAATETCVLFDATADNPENLRSMLTGSLDLDAMRRAYQAVLDQYRPLLAALEAGQPIAPLDAMAVRTLLIHDFRRAVLKDPALPPEILGENWPGPEARRLTGRLYDKLLQPSENWLDTCDGGLDGPLPAPGPALLQRFTIPD